MHLYFDHFLLFIHKLDKGTFLKYLELLFCEMVKCKLKKGFLHFLLNVTLKNHQKQKCNEKIIKTCLSTSVKTILENSTNFNRKMASVHFIHKQKKLVKRRVHSMNIALQVYVKKVLCIFLSSIIMGLINIFHFIHDVHTYFTFPQSLEGIFFLLK